MSEKQICLQAQRKELSKLNDYMKQLSEMSNQYQPKTEEMKEICDAGQRAVKRALEIFKDISELEKN